MGPARNEFTRYLRIALMPESGQRSGADRFSGVPCSERTEQFEIVGFFDHHLKGAPAPKWLTDGVPFLDKDNVKEPK